MQRPFEVALVTPNLEIVSSNRKSPKLFEVDPLKSRESKTISLTLKVKDDDNGTYSRELQDHKDGLKIQFMLNEFGSNVGKSNQ